MFGAYDMAILPARDEHQPPFDFGAACAASQEEADAVDDFLDADSDVDPDVSESHDQPLPHGPPPPPPTPANPPAPTLPSSTRRPSKRRNDKQRKESQRSNPYHQAKRNSKKISLGLPVETPLATDDLPHPIPAYTGANAPQHRKKLGEIESLGSTGPECLAKGRALGFTLLRLQP